VLIGDDPVPVHPVARVECNALRLVPQDISPQHPTGKRAIAVVHLHIAPFLIGDQYSAAGGVRGDRLDLAQPAGAGRITKCTQIRHVHAITGHGDPEPFHALAEIAVSGRAPEKAAVVVRHENLEARRVMLEYPDAIGSAEHTSSEGRHGVERRQAQCLHPCIVALDHECDIAHDGDAVRPAELAGRRAVAPCRADRCSGHGIIHVQPVRHLARRDYPTLAGRGQPDGRRIHVRGGLGAGEENLLDHRRGDLLGRAAAARGEPEDEGKGRPWKPGDIGRCYERRSFRSCLMMS
jgi:hypothetical protein